MRKSDTFNDTTTTPPEIGMQVEISEDPKYSKNFANQVTYTNFRDGPIIILNNITYFGEKYERHEQLLNRLIDVNDPNNENVELGYGYFLQDFLGKPSAFFDNYEDAEKYKDSILAANFDCVVYYIKDVLKFERVAKYMKQLKKGL